jgi:predicted outer membrane repeat protein
VDEVLQIILRSANNTAANGGAIAGAGTLRIGDFSPDGGRTFQPITIEGQLRSIPESSSILLLTLGSMGLVVARLRHRVRA